MSFRKNQRRETFGYQKIDGITYLPVSGKRILEGSTINQLLLDASGKEAIVIYGTYEVKIEGESLKSEELVEEYVDYLEQVLVGSTIRSAIIHSQMSLTIKLDSSPAIEIYIDNSLPHYYDVAWGYNS